MLFISIVVGWFLAIVILVNYKTLRKLYLAYYFFSKETIIDNFRSIRYLDWPYKTAHCSEDVAFFHETYKNNKDLPLYFIFRNKEINIRDWAKKHITTGLIVLKICNTSDAKLLYEKYYNGNSEYDKTISWSLNKSVVSALIGIAIKEGKIKSIDDYVSDYDIIIFSRKDNNKDNFVI